MISCDPLFTVATVTYNSAKWIRQTIESVLSSTYTNFEYIISDDSSTDDTWDIIAQYSSSKIQKFRNDSNLGEYKNRNLIIDKAKGKYILFVDGDDILYKNTLRNLSEYINSFPTAGMIWGLNPQKFSDIVFPYLVSPFLNLNLIYRTNLPIANIGLGEILFKVSVLKKVGGFNTSYKIADTHIKKYLALTENVLFVSIGFMHWRHHPEQASFLISKQRLDSFRERIIIDSQIIRNENFPISGNGLKTIKRNFEISKMKLLVKHTILRGDIIGFFRLFKTLKLKWTCFIFLFYKGDYSFLPSKEIGNPLFNEYNFKL
jgi:glycosyltransferase involved in cell wall biosynthesis